MTSHGFVGGKRTSNKEAIIRAVYEAAGIALVKGIKITFLDKMPTIKGRELELNNTIVEFDCHDQNGSANLPRVDEFYQRLVEATSEEPARVEWGRPLVLP